MKLCRRIKIGLAGLLMVLGVCIPCVTVYAKEAEAETEDIATIITNDERFHTASTLFKAAGLVDALEGEGPYTVFIPSDEAFKKLPAETFTNLIRLENKDKLEDLLTYHIYTKGATKAQLTGFAGQEFTMLDGKKATVSCKDGTVTINKANIIVADIPASNGVIHVIDTVLVPKG